MGKQFRKQFQGVILTDDIRKLVQQTIDDVSKKQGENADPQKQQDMEDTTSTTTNAVKTATKNPLASLFEDMDQSHCINVLRSIDLAGDHLSVTAIRALNSIMNQTQQTRLDSALKSSKLSFTCPQNKNTRTEEEEIEFQKRMDWLRCRQEESNYVKLTHNIGTSHKTDDVTTKSMMYATSIGLNMIVAPLSFGVFMYFFGGSLLNFVFPVSTDATTDIRRVILGVISGVAMLFIEMILFVIRTHELESAVRRKEQRQLKKNGGFQPFGVYTKPTVKTKKDRRSKRE